MQSSERPINALQVLYFGINSGFVGLIKEMSQYESCSLTITSELLATNMPVVCLCGESVDKNKDIDVRKSKHHVWSLKELD